MAGIVHKTLDYEVKFNKRALEPNEFEDLLKQKVEKLLEPANLQRIKTLKTKAVNTVKQLSMRKKTTGPGMDKRYKSVQKNIDEGYLRNPEDSPIKYNEESGGKQGQSKKKKEWHGSYHERQHKLFNGPLKQKLETVFSTILIKDEEKKRGYLFHRETGKELTPIEFCNVIDGLTANLVKNLSALQKEKQLLDKSLNFEEVSELCEDIVLGRHAVDWVAVNDLMKENETQIWRDHVLVLVSFGALMAVSLMILKFVGPAHHPNDSTKLRSIAFDVFLGVAVVLLLLAIWSGLTSSLLVQLLNTVFFSVFKFIAIFNLLDFNSGS